MSKLIRLQEPKLSRYDAALDRFLTSCGDLTPEERAAAIAAFEKTQFALSARIGDLADAILEACRAERVVIWLNRLVGSR